LEDERLPALPNIHQPKCALLCPHRADLRRRKVVVRRGLRNGWRRQEFRFRGLFESRLYKFNSPPPTLMTRADFIDSLRVSKPRLPRPAQPPELRLSPARA